MQALLFCVLLDWRIGLSLIAMHLDDPNFSTLDLPQRLEERLRMESKRPEVRMDSTKSVDPIVKFQGIAPFQSVSSATHL